MVEKSSYYFAYGSNLNVSRLLSRCPDAVIVGKAELKNYRLCFMTNNSGKVVANIFEVGEKSKETVAGVVYELTKADKAILDTYEGYPYVYDRVPVKVDMKGREVTCFTYLMYPTFERYSRLSRFDFWDIDTKERVVTGKKIHRRFGVPTPEYKNHLIKGYKMFGLNVQAIAKANEYSGRRNKAEWKPI